MNPGIFTGERRSVARVDCMPEAPADWRRVPFRNVADVNPIYRLNPEGTYPFVEMASVAEKFAGIQRFEPRQFQSGFSRFKANDTIFAKITPCAEHGKIALVPEMVNVYGTGSTEFIVLSPKTGVDPRFLFFLASCPAVHTRAVSRMEGSTGRLRVSETTFTKWLWVSIPEPTEQARIASVLAAADDHILALDEQIRRADRVKKSLLQSVFIRGLPGTNPSLQATRIGEVPAHWIVCQVRNLLDGIPFNGVSPESRPNPPGTPILNVGCISEGVCTVDQLSYVDVDAETVLECGATRGDFFVLRGNGNREYVATGGWLRVDPPANCIFSDKLIRLRFRTDRVAEGFIPYLWQSRWFLDRLQSKAQSGSGLWMITKRDIGHEWLALPPQPEQERIVELLDAATANGHSLSLRLQAARRVKQSLLQNLLTGRIRLKP